MAFNYRVFKKTVGSNVFYELREAYYSSDGKTVHSWTAEPVHPIGETLEELIADLGQMLAALTYPVLVETTENTAIEIEPALFSESEEQELEEE